MEQLIMVAMFWEMVLLLQELLQTHLLQIIWLVEQPIIFMFLD
jgi:hypothetical protein